MIMLNKLVRAIVLSIMHATHGRRCVESPDGAATRLPPGPRDEATRLPPGPRDEAPRSAFPGRPSPARCHGVAWHLIYFNYFDFLPWHPPGWGLLIAGSHLSVCYGYLPITKGNFGGPISWESAAPSEITNWRLGALAASPSVWEREKETERSRQAQREEEEEEEREGSKPNSHLKCYYAHKL